MRASVKFVLLLVVCLVALPAIAGEGRRPIYQQSTTIINPGMYVVTRNITGLAGAPVIDIQAPDVEIDLNGMVLQGGDPTMPVIQAVGVENITIRNGTLFGGRDGIWINLGAGFGRKVIVEYVRILDPAQDGIHLDGMTDFALRRNNVVNAGQEGIEVDGSVVPNPVQGTIEDNQVEQCGGGIRVTNGSSVAILNNRLDRIAVVPPAAPPAQGAIVYDLSEGGLIANNTIEEVTQVNFQGGGNGIYLGDAVATKVYNNVVVRCENHGIWIAGFSDDNLILENVVRDSGWDGLRIEGSGNHVDRNLLNLNCGLGNGACWGLHFSNAFGGYGNTYGRNTARRNNGNPAICPTAPPPANPPTTDFCDEQPLGPPGYGNDSFFENYMPTFF